MPTRLDTPEWGEVQALTVRETAKRMHEHPGNIEWFVQWDLLQSYMVTDDHNGCIKSQTLYIDMVDVAHAEKFAKQFPPDAPWERILWARYEVRVWREKQGTPDTRTTERTMVQPQQQQRPQRPQPPAPQKPSKLPRELRNTEFFDELDERQPSRPRRAEPIQTVPPAGRQQQRRDLIEEDDYYAEPDAETEHDTGGRKQQPPRKRGLRLW